MKLKVDVQSVGIVRVALVVMENELLALHHTGRVLVDPWSVQLAVAMLQEPFGVVVTVKDKGAINSVRVSNCDLHWASSTVRASACVSVGIINSHQLA